jgi:hypothetical protein
MLIDLFGNDVFVILTEDQRVVHHRGSNPAVERQYAPRGATIGATAHNAEEAIQRTINACGRSAQLSTFRVNSNSSRVYVAKLSATRRLIVVNSAPQGIPDDPPDFEQRLNQICGEFKAIISGFAPSHDPL